MPPAFKKIIKPLGFSYITCGNFPLSTLLRTSGHKISYLGYLVSTLKDYLDKEFPKSSHGGMNHI